MYKILLIGSAGVGKTSLIFQYTEMVFDKNLRVTIHPDFNYRNIQINNNTIKLQIWDTAGGERFRTIFQIYYRKCDGIIVVFDKSQRESFESVDYWMKEIREYASKNVKAIIVGNKSDLECVVSDEEAQEKAESLKTEYIPTSAKIFNDVNLVFEILTRKILDGESLRKVKKN